MVVAPGHRKLVTHIFAAGDQYLDSDVVFGVKNSLVEEYPGSSRGQGARWPRHGWRLVQPRARVPARPSRLRGTPLRSKLYTGPAAALDGLLFDGMTIMCGGFGLSGNPSSLKSAGAG